MILQVAVGCFCVNICIEMCVFTYISTKNVRRLSYAETLIHVRQPLIPHTSNHILTRAYPHLQAAEKLAAERTSRVRSLEMIVGDTHPNGTPHDFNMPIRPVLASELLCDYSGNPPTASVHWNDHSECGQDKQRRPRSADFAVTDAHMSSQLTRPNSESEPRGSTQFSRRPDNFRNSESEQTFQQARPPSQTPGSTQYSRRTQIQAPQNQNGSSADYKPAYKSTSPLRLGWHSEHDQNDRQATHRNGVGRQNEDHTDTRGDMYSKRERFSTGNMRENNKPDQRASVLDQDLGISALIKSLTNQIYSNSMTKPIASEARRPVSLTSRSYSETQKPASMGEVTFSGSKLESGGSSTTRTTWTGRLIPSTARGVVDHKLQVTHLKCVSLRVCVCVCVCVCLGMRKNYIYGACITCWKRCIICVRVCCVYYMGWKANIRYCALTQTYTYNHRVWFQKTLALLRRDGKGASPRMV